MADDKHIVVWDPLGEFEQGSLLTAEEANLLHQNHGAVVMPTDVGLHRRSGVGGFAFRAWGAGFPLESTYPRHVCPLVLFGDGEHGYVHWAVRLVAEEELYEQVRGGRKLEGQIRFGGDSSQINHLHPPLAATDTAIHGHKLTASSMHRTGGWIVGGVIPYQPRAGDGGGHYPFSVYGRMEGLKAAWAACTKTGAVRGVMGGWG